MSKNTPELQYANPALTDKQIEIITDVMNATIHECVFVVANLDAGSIEDAQNALIQIRMNAETQLERLEKILKRGAALLAKEGA